MGKELGFDACIKHVTPAWRVVACTAACALGLGVGVAMTASVPTAAHAEQRVRPVAAITCDADLSLCRALVQALSREAPFYVFRINPRPLPPGAFTIRLDLDGSGQARLHWQDTQSGAAVPSRGLSETELAQKLVQASPALTAQL